MCRKLIYLISFVLVLGLVGSASAALPQGWMSQDINTTGGSADESGGTWTVSGDGADIWGTSDAFHYAYVPLSGDGMIVARVVDNGTGSNAWAKGGVMIRETLEADSKHAMMIVTGGNGGGAAFQWRPTTGSSSVSSHDPSPTVSPPWWVKIVREGDDFSGFLSQDGVEWTQQGSPTTIQMENDINIGVCVTSHASGEVRAYTFDNVSTELPKMALRPEPADGAVYPDTWVNLAWSPGATAVSHDVYFSDNFDYVNDRAPEAFQGNQPATFFVIGFPGFPYPDGLVPGTTYYWRVDELEADGTTKYEAKVWSFMVPPRKAYNPAPADGASFIAPDTTLSWDIGFGAKLHTVYFGDNFDDVNNATGGLPQGITTYTPGTLELEKTYYWRVDEFDAITTHKGDVWSLTTTLPGLGTIMSERWENIQTTDLNTLKSSPKFPHSPDVTELVTKFEWNGPDIDNYGGRIHGWVYAPATGYYTLWLCTDDQGELWLSTDDDPGNVVLVASESSWSPANSWGRGEEQSELISLTGGNKYYIMALWKEGGGGDHCQVAWQGPGIPERTIIPGTNLSVFKPIQAYGANPSNRAVDVKQTTTLSWKPGDYAASHQVYFGTDAEAVKNANTGSPEYKGTRNLGSESYDPGKLEWDTTYYWRIDEVNNANPDSPWTGNLWSFTTANFLVVDDFESYNDLDPDDPESNRIFNAWLDGYGIPTNGSIVGYENPPFAEQTIVHSGSQSMPLSYDNSVGYSEATLTLTYPRDWTEKGVNTLTIWFRGDSANAAETLYVALNG
ncbi:MAG: hypothetical protein ABIL62_11955, partial [Planctomycetota bacterium]